MNLSHRASSYFLSFIFGFGKEIISYFLLLFLSLLVWVTLFLFLLFLFGLRAWSALYQLETARLALTVLCLFVHLLVPFGLELYRVKIIMLFYTVLVYYYQVFSVWQSFPHKLDCLSRSHAWISWRFLWHYQCLLGADSQRLQLASIQRMLGLIIVIYQGHPVPTWTL